MLHNFKIYSSNLCVGCRDSILPTTACKIALSDGEVTLLYNTNGASNVLYQLISFFGPAVSDYQTFLTTHPLQYPQVFQRRKTVIITIPKLQLRVTANVSSLADFQYVGISHVHSRCSSSTVYFSYIGKIVTVSK